MALLDRCFGDPPQPVEARGRHLAASALRVQPSDCGNPNLGRLLDQPGRPSRAGQRNPELEPQYGLVRRGLATQPHLGLLCQQSLHAPPSRRTPTVCEAHLGADGQPAHPEEMMMPLSTERDDLVAECLWRHEAGRVAHLRTSAR